MTEKFAAPIRFSTGSGPSGGRVPAGSASCRTAELEISYCRPEEAESRREKWLRKCDELDIGFSTPAVIRWECGVPFSSPCSKKTTITMT